ncbi:PREDICTED: cytochrome P450 26C1 [Myotis brandtii]|uniref:cytochrome P450 26C1 n=1 Tax=Myotis brandtii TaxID=109478 RepID=UPI0007040EDC|nr:PREDICTED: cytochrome P450 26C1 [Myotis brandtii]
MFPCGLSCLSVLGAAGTALLCAGLLLSLAQHLWTLRWMLSRDRASALPLPKGSMGWPFFGETLHWLVQGSRFHSSRRERYGTVFKTHLLGRPVIRVSGAENVRTILLGEHRIVRSQWPQSAHILLGSHTLLGAVGEPHRQRRKVYDAAKALTFRMAARILLGLRLDEAQCSELSRTFEQFVENLFSLPLDVPFSGLRKGIRARDQLHRHLEEAIAEKLHEDMAGEPGDALAMIIHSTRELGHELSVQELKESAVELLFAAFFTTASASTSLVLLLLQHPAAIAKIRQELETSLVIAYQESRHHGDWDSALEEIIMERKGAAPQTPHPKWGYQIPKGWSVMYSIRDTHETAAVYRSPPEGFDPERFGASGEEARGASGRFHYIPFAVELVRTARWELATPAFPAMQTVPIVHPVDGLRLFFHPLAHSAARDGLCL